MPKFLRIGLHHSNVSGDTSKAWCVRRVGSTIFLKWGAVEVQGTGSGRKVYWTRPPHGAARPGLSQGRDRAPPKELMKAQSAISFRDHGMHQLKGVPERWRS